MNLPEGKLYLKDIIPLKSDIMSDYDTKLVVSVTLTQKEVDALWIASRFVGGSYNSMRRVFNKLHSDKRSNSFKSKLKRYVDIDNVKKIRDSTTGKLTFIK